MTYDITIVGGGIVGLATAWKIMEQHPGIQLAVVEKEAQPATHQTDRNSGVIHSGIYYKPGSDKAINCVKGHGMLISFCDEFDVPYRLCGKVIAAVNETDIPVMDGIFQRGLQNGLDGIKKIDSSEVRSIEPFCRAFQGIWVPQAGIIDFRQLALRLRQLVEDAGGRIITSFKVEGIKEERDRLILRSAGNLIETKFAIGCAGLYADHLARLAGLDPPHQIVPFRGEFYQLIPEAEKYVQGLIYPVPDIKFPFLGVHLTRRINGGVEAGPNAVLAFRREGYAHFDVHWAELMESLRYRGFHKMARRHWRKGMDEMVRSFSKRAFLKSLQRLVPDLKSKDIVRSRTGVRAQALDRNGNLIDDYVILRQDRMLHLLNAPSPAATSCLSIGEYVASLV